MQQLVCLVILLLPLSCGTKATPEPGAAAADADTAAVPQTDATREMVRELGRLHQQSLANARSYYYLNAARAAEIRRAAAGTSLSPRMRRALSIELLNGGETEAAISELRHLLEDGDSPEFESRERDALAQLLAIAYLRLGEQQNCIAHPTATACIMPFAESAVHTHAEGSRRAVDLYARLLARRPSDYASRWLLNVGHMTLGGYPERIPAEYLIPGLMGDTASAFPTFPNIAVTGGVDLDDLAGGVALEDFNNDGHIDIFATAHRLNDEAKLFLGDGSGGFVDRSRQAGLQGISGGLNLVHADYDNDGYEDVFILRGGWLGEAGRHPNSLLMNNGDGTFQDVTKAAGLFSYHPSQSAAFQDYNGDGHLDLFVGNEESDRWLAAWQSASIDLPGGGGHPSALYKNNGDGTFTDVSAQVGIDVTAFVKGAAWGDVNNDRLPDLYLSIIGGPNRLFMNRGPEESTGWRFEEVGAGVHEPFFSFATWFFDVDNDGWEDLFVAPYDLRRIGDAAGDVAREYLARPVDTEMPRLFRNNGDGTFTNVTERAGLDKVMFAMGANFGDLDNDGFLDLYVGTGAPDLRSIIPNRMFQNIEGRRFEEVTLEGGFGHIQKGHGIAFADIDADGDQDIYASMGGVYEGDGFNNVLFENPGFSGDPSWVVLRLEGRRSNRSAIGARIKVMTQEPGGAQRSIYRTVSTGGSFGSSSLQQEIGLGGADAIVEIRIEWPNAERTVEVFTNLPVNRYYDIIEGRGEAIEQPI